MNYTYLLIDLGSILVPFIYSFHPRVQFHKTWKAFWPVLIGVAIPFIIWDAIFTGQGVWGFTPEYLIGLSFFGLPIEEILFFICIPYACVFSYHVLLVTDTPDFFQHIHHKISLFLIIFLLLGAAVFHDKIYTLVTFVSLGAWITLCSFVWKWEWMGRFYFAYLILLIPFFIVNGILTGTFLETQVVWYADSGNIGFRLGTIPFEDTFYGMLLILMNVTGYNWLMKRMKIDPLSVIEKPSP